MALAALFVVALFAGIMPAPVAAAGGTQLKFIIQPSTTGAGEPIGPTVQVGVFTPSNVLDTGSAATITLKLAARTCPNISPRPCGELLYGTTAAQQGAITVTSVGGIASFKTLRVDAIGKDYRLLATSPGLASATSRLFDATPGHPWSQFHREGANTASTGFSAAMGAPVALPDFVPGIDPIVASPLIVDLDRNGLMDIVTVNNFENKPANPIVTAYYQTAAGTFGAPNVYTIPSPGSCGAGQCPFGRTFLAAGDLQGDGNIQVVAYSAQYNSYVENPPGVWTVSPNPTAVDAFMLTVLDGPSLTRLASSRITTATINPVHPVIGDLDGDGINEIVILTSTTVISYPDTISVYKYFGPNSLFRMAGVTNPMVIYSNGPATQCINGYGIMTAVPVIGEFRSAHLGLELVVGTNSAAFPFPCQPGPETAMADGRLYMCYYTGSLTCPDTVQLPKALGTPNDETTGHVPEVAGMSAADLDGDGLMDIVVNARHRNTDPSQTDTLEVVTVKAVGSPVMTIASTLADGFVWNTAALGDVDGDAQPDIANVRYSTDSSDSAKAGDVSIRGYNGALVNKGTLARPAPAPGISTQSQGGGALVDLDRDGKMEFVFGSANKAFVATKGGASGPTNPTSFFAPASTSGVPISPPALGDLNGDCRPEVLVGMDNGKLASIKGLDAALAGAPDLSVITGPPYAAPGAGLQTKLFWNAPADGGLPIISYHVWRSASSGSTAPSDSTYSSLGVWRGAAPPTQATPFVDDLDPTNNAANPGYGEYHYKVTAVTCLGESLRSADFYADVQKAAAPNALAASITFGAAPAYSTTLTVKLTWLASAAGTARPNGCGPVDTPDATDGYNVYRRVANGVYPSTPLNGATPVSDSGASYTTTSTATYSFSDATVPPGASYDYKVVPVSCDGAGNPSSLTIDLKYPDAPASLLVVSSGAPAYKAPIVARLSWTAPAIIHGCGSVEGYRVYRNSIFLTEIRPGSWNKATAPANPGASSLAYDDLTIVLGTSYLYEVKAVNCVGEASSGATFNLGNTVPSKPQSPVVLRVGANVEVTWQVPAQINGCGAIEGYQIYRSGSSGTETLYATLLPASSNTPAKSAPWTNSNPTATPVLAPFVQLKYIDAAPLVGTGYYKVTAVNCVGESDIALSDERNTATPPPTVGTLTSMTVTPSSTIELTTGTSYTFAFTTQTAWPATGTLNIEFPAGYVLTSLGGTATGTGCTGSFAVTKSGQIVTVARSGGSACAPGAKTIVLTGIKNPANGLQTFQLTTKNAGTDLDTGSPTVTIVPQLNIGLSPTTASSPTGAQRLLTTTVVGASAAATCAWTVTDADPTYTMTTATALSPTNCVKAVLTSTVPSPGGYPFKVKVTLTDGSSVVSATSFITFIPNQGPDAEFQVSSTESHTNEQVSFADTSTDDSAIVSRSWDFGDGSTSQLTGLLHSFVNPGSYAVRLTVTDDSGESATRTRTITVSPPENAAPGDVPAKPLPSVGTPGPTEPVPIASAGKDLSTSGGLEVTLFGQANSRSSGYYFSWRQVDGPVVELQGADTATATFVAPLGDVNDPVVLAFELIVSDGSHASLPDKVLVTVAPRGTPPVALVAAVPLAVEGQTVHLSANASYDADNEHLTFRWTQVDGPDALLDNPLVAAPSFVVPAGTAGRQLVFQVNVTDGRHYTLATAQVVVKAGATVPATAPVTVVEAQAPTRISHDVTARATPGLSLGLVLAGLALVAAFGRRRRA